MASVSCLAVGILGLAAVLGEGRRVDVKAVMAAMRKADAGQARDISKSHVVFQNAGQMIFQIDTGMVPGSPAATVTNVVGAPAQPQQANAQPQVEHAIPQALVATSSQQQPDAAPQVQQIKDAAQSAAHEVAAVVTAEDISGSHVVFNNDGQMIFQIEIGSPPVAPPAENATENATENSTENSISESLVVFNNTGQMIFQMNNFLLPGASPATVTNLVGAPEQPQQASAGGVQNVISHDAILEAALANQAAAMTKTQQQPQEQNATPATSSPQQPDAAAQGQQSKDAHQPVASSPDISESDVVVNNAGQFIFQMDNFLLPGTSPATVTNLVGVPEQNH